jgi:hypothetical protein
MSNFVSANPDISSGSAQKLKIIDGTIHNLLVTGNLTSTANIGNIQELVVSNIYSSFASFDQLIANSGDIKFLSTRVANIGGIFVGGNVVADYFIGNGALLSGVEQHVPSEIIADVLGNVTATGNVEAEYFLGNGARLTGITTTANVNVNFSTDKYLSAVVTQSDVYLSANAVNSPGMLTSLNSFGKISQQHLDGYLITPEGYVADAAARLGLGGGDLPIGSIVRQIDDGNSYMLTMSPSNIGANWITSNGIIFPVNTVFGRTGDVFSTYGDYLDNYIELSESVGVVPAGNAVSEALEMLQNTKQDNIVRHSKWLTGNNQSISNSITIPVSFNSFYTTGAANVSIIPSNSGGIPSARFINAGNDALFTISTRVTLENMAPGGQTNIVLALNGNTNSVNRIAESYQASITPQETQIHSLSSTVFIPTNEFIEILATVDNTRTCYIDGLLSISQV